MVHPSSGHAAGGRPSAPARLSAMFSREWGLSRAVTPCRMEAPQPTQNTQAAAAQRTNGQAHDACAAYKLCEGRH
jgi:hypothetical protein